MGLLDEVMDWFKKNIEQTTSEEQPTEGYNPEVNKPNIFAQIAGSDQQEEVSDDNGDWVETLGRQSLSLGPGPTDETVPQHSGSYPTRLVPEPGRRAYEAPPVEEPPKSGESVDDYITRTTQEEKGARQEITTGSLSDLAKKYGGEISPSGGIISEKEIPSSEGLVDKGYVEKDGKKIHIYGKPESKVAEKGGENERGDNDSKITAFENAVVKKMGYDPRSFNPAEEARKVVEKDKKALFSHIFGGIRPDELTPEMRKHWGSELDKYYNQKFNEFKTKKANDEGMLKTLVSRFEKEHLEKYSTAPEGSKIWDKTTGKEVGQIGQKKKDTILPAQASNEIEKLVERRFRGSADESKTLMGAKVYDALPADRQDEYNNITDAAKRFMLDAMNKKEPITADEAVKMAMEKIKEKEPQLPKTRQEAIATLKKRFPMASDKQINDAITKKFPNLK